MRTPLALALLMLATTACLAAGSTFHAYSWAVVPDDCAHITPFVWFNAQSKPEDVAAEALTRPAGQCAVFSWDLHRGVLDDPADKCLDANGKSTQYQGVWPEHGVADVAGKFKRFFATYQAAGGKLDWFILDYEGGYSNWQLGTDRERWLAIQNDPRFLALAQKLGFSDMMLLAEWWKGSGKYLVWNAITGGMVNEALEQACFQPIRALYPKALGSNYGANTITAENAVPDLNGHMQWSAPLVMGTHQAPSFYGWIGQLGDRQLDGKKPFGRSAYAGTLLTLNTMRAMQRSSAVPITPWVAWQRYSGDGPTAPPATFANTPYYREMVLHLAVGGVTTFLLWNPHPWAANQDPESMSTARDERLLERILKELDERLPGAKRRSFTTEAIPWDAPLLATALQIGDKVTWRLTAPPSVTEIRGKLDGRPVTMKVTEAEPGVWFTHSANEKLTDLQVGP